MRQKWGWVEGEFAGKLGWAGLVLHSIKPSSLIYRLSVGKNDDTGEVGFWFLGPFDYHPKPTPTRCQLIAPRPFSFSLSF